MIAFFANIFGYLLNFLYNIVENYGLAIVLFCIVIKLLMLPLSIKQQRTLNKNTKVQSELKEIQFKYKNDQEKMNQEIMALYKREKMNPFGGCFSAIIQIILLLSVFYMVKEPLTYMKKIDADTINYYVSIVNEEGLASNQAYSQIAVISETEQIREIQESREAEGDTEAEDNNIASIEELSMDMNFLGIDLGKVPMQNVSDFKVYIIPVLYVISSFISMRLVTKMQNGTNENKNKEEGDKDKPEEVDPLVQANKNMSYIMPIMALSISLIAPLGLALYWLVNNVLMIIEKIVLNNFLKDKEDEQNA